MNLKLYLQGVKKLRKVHVKEKMASFESKHSENHTNVY